MLRRLSLWRLTATCHLSSALTQPARLAALAPWRSFAAKTKGKKLSHAQLRNIAKQKRGLAAFNTYYTGVYGARWPGLAAALLQPTKKVAILNRYASKEVLEFTRAELRKLGSQPYVWPESMLANLPAGYTLPECFHFPFPASIAPPANPPEVLPPEAWTVDPHRFAPPDQILAKLKYEQGDDVFKPDRTPYYILDLGSVLAVETMRLRPTDHVFDLCAAPGGKSVCITQHLDFKPPAAASTAGAMPLPCAAAAATNSAVLSVNDTSESRLMRLRQVISSYLPSSISTDRAHIQIHDLDLLQSKVPHERFDAVLLDAPCSTDRHTIQTAKELGAWSVTRFSRDHDRQVLLLLQALRTVKIGGTVLYATCSLTPKENDEVITAVRDLCDKWKSKGRMGKDGTQIDFVVEKIGLAEQQQNAATSTVTSADAAASAPVVTLPFGEPTQHGWLILPDQLLPTTVAAVSSSSASAAGSSSASRLVHGFGPLYIARLRRIPGGVVPA